MPTVTPQFNLFDSEPVLFLLKFGLLIILTFYVLFALLIVRQVELMGKTLITKISSTLKMLAIVHAVCAIGLAVIAWSIL